MMSNIYEANLLDIASKLDAMTESCGEITKLSKNIVDEFDDNSIRAIAQKISDVTLSDNYNKGIKQFANALKKSLVEYCGYIYVKKACNSQESIIGEMDNRTLEALLEELNRLVGLKEVKKKVNDLIIYQTVQKKRKEKGLLNQKGTLHMAFTGNPGTGKTTVARIVGHLYKKIGLLSKGHFVEVSRTDLIAGYQGQTAHKVKKVIESAKGGVLFIDEAYSITENDHSDSYGRECLTELTKALEDYREDLVVIVAGYTKPMEAFFDSNPGLRSRFNTFIEFDDYDSGEMVDIFESICFKNNYSIEENLKNKLKVYFDEIISKQDESFANGRFARNIYDDLVMQHAKRVVELVEPSVEDLSVIKIDDFISSDFGHVVETDI